MKLIHDPSEQNLDNLVLVCKQFGRFAMVNLDLVFTTPTGGFLVIIERHVQQSNRLLAQSSWSCYVQCANLAWLRQEYVFSFSSNDTL